MRFIALLLLFVLVSGVLARIPVDADSSASHLGGPMTRMSDSGSSHAKPTKSTHHQSSSHKSSKPSKTGGPGDKQTANTSNTGIPPMTSSSMSKLASSQVASALSQNGSQNSIVGMAPGVLATMLLASTITLLLFIA